MGSRSVRRIIPGLIAGLIAVLSAFAVAGPGEAVAAARACANAHKPVAGATRAQIKRAVVCLVDRQRVERGLPPLSGNARLNRSAQEWTRTMVASGDFTHGSDFAARITQVGFVWSAAGENIATGFLTPAQVVTAWMGSLGHCQNILNPGFSEIGIGVLARPVPNFASGPATWTADFALPAGARAPSANDGPMNGCPYTT